MKPKLFKLAAFVFVTQAFVPSLHAQTFTWSGGGGDDLFGTGANWGGAAPSPGSGSDLIFGGTTRLAPNNNYTAWDDFRSVFFAAGAGSFNVSGSPVDLFGKIENNSANLQTFGLEFSVNGGSGEINPVDGDLLINGSNIFNNGNAIHIWGNNGRTVTIESVIQGGGGLVLQQNSTAILAGNNSYSGGTTINAGVLRVGNGGLTGSLGSGDVTNNTSLVFNRSDDFTVSNGISGSGSVTKLGAGVLTFDTRKLYTGNTVVDGGVLNLTGGGGQDGTLRGMVTVNNGGMLRLSTGDATGWGTGAQRISAIRVNEGGTLNVNTTSNQTFSNMAITLQGGTISGIAGSNFDFFSGGTSLTTLGSATSATVSMNANLRQASTTFDIAEGDAAVDFIWSGQLNQNGGGRNFVKTGAGRMNLTGAASFSGTTTVDGGHLAVSNTVRSTSSITVNNGATLELGATNMFVGGHGTAVNNGMVITANASNLLMNASMDSRIGNVTLHNGSTWTSNRGFGGWDVVLGNVLLPDAGTVAATVTVSGSGVSTMNGSGGIHLQGIQRFTVGDTTGNSDADLVVSMRLDNPGFAGGAVGGIRKSGSGTMFLDQTGNSFAGDLIIEQGAIVTGTTQGGGVSGYLGAVNGTRTITVNSGALLEMRANNQFGGSGKTAATIPQMVLDGGTLHSTRFNIVGNLTLNGATLSQSVSDSGNYEGYQFLGSVTVGGSSVSTISSGNGKANHLANGTTTFAVSDATGDSAADLVVSAILRNASGDYGSGAGSLEKTGAGTMVLAASNTYTGATIVSAGTLWVTGALGESAVTVKDGGTVGGTGTLGGSLTFEAGAMLDLSGATLGLTSSGILSVAAGQGISLTDFGFSSISGWNWAAADEGTYTLIDGGGTVTLAGTTPTELSPFDFGNGKQGYFQAGSLQVVIIPEPSISLLGGIGLLLLVRRRR